jgi:hypothetical protein
MFHFGEPLWLSGKVVKNEKINEFKRTRVRSPPRATSLKREFKKKKCFIELGPLLIHIKSRSEPLLGRKL